MALLLEEAVVDGQDVNWAESRKSVLERGEPRMPTAWPESGSLEPADSPPENNAVFLLSSHGRDTVPCAQG